MVLFLGLRRPLIYAAFAEFSKAENEAETLQNKGFSVASGC